MQGRHGVGSPTYCTGKEDAVEGVRVRDVGRVNWADCKSGTAGSAGARVRFCIRQSTKQSEKV